MINDALIHPMDTFDTDYYDELLAHKFIRLEAIQPNAMMYVLSSNVVGQVVQFFIILTPLLGIVYLIKSDWVVGIILLIIGFAIYEVNERATGRALVSLVTSSKKMFIMNFNKSRIKIVTPTVVYDKKLGFHLAPIISGAYAEYMRSKSHHRQ